MINTCYKTLGHQLLEDYDGHLFPHADMAATAAGKALQEAKGWENPFEHIDHFYKGTGPNKGFMSLGSKTKMGDWEPTIDYSEEHWAHLAAVGDTAGAAAQAYASSKNSKACDKEKLKEFWLWWLRDALPEAWRLTSWDWVSK